MLKTSEIRLVAFDCDGVLFDSTQANIAYYNTILSHFGLPSMTPDQFKYVHMHTVDNALAFLFPEPDALEKAQAYRSQMSYQPFLKYMEIEPHLRTVLSDLRPQFKTAIATNRSDTMIPLLAAHNLESEFDLVVRSIDVPRPKPHPDLLLHLLDHFSIEPTQAVYVGDSELDEQAARAAKVPLIAYRNPALAADAYISGLDQLRFLLNKSKRP